MRWFTWTVAAASVGTLLSVLNHQHVTFNYYWELLIIASANSSTAFSAGFY